MRRRTLVLGLPLMLALYPVSGLRAEGSAVAPGALPDLSGEVMLTINGLDAEVFPDGVLELDLGRLTALGVSEFETSSIWTEGSHQYSGLMLADLVAALGLTDPEMQLQFRALNDYMVEFPLAEVRRDAPLLAYLTDGKPMSVREKGPIWMIYPFDSSVDYRTDTIYSRSVWQLDRITLLR